MVRGVSIRHGAERVPDERKEELKAFSERVNYFEANLLIDFLLMRKNIIAFENFEKFPVNSTVSFVRTKTGEVMTGIVLAYNGTKASVNVDGTIWTVDSAMFYQ